MVADDLLRLAWEAEHDGRSKLRDALLTLAVAESEPGETWADRCRDRLLRDRPDHFLAQFPTVGQALADPRVIDARDRLRAKYPPARVQSLLLKAVAGRGPYLGRVESIDAMLEDLVGFVSAEVDNVRLDAPQPSRGPRIRQNAARPLALALAYPPLNRSTGNHRVSIDDTEMPSDWEVSVKGTSLDSDFLAYYASVFLAIAFLLATIRQDQRSPQESVDE